MSQECVRRQGALHGWVAPKVRAAVIVVRLVSGLGNQLFQYALGRRLAIDRGVPLGLDLSFYGTQELRSYGLKHFNISAQEATEADILRAVRRRRRHIGDRLYRMACPWLPYRWQPRVKERRWAYDPEVLNVGQNILLIGYWQSYRYFESIANILDAEYTLRVPMCSQATRVLDAIGASESVAVHVRRGDYVSDPEAASLLGFCGLDYYHRAIRMAIDLAPGSRQFIFSDEPDWVRANMALDSTAVVVSQKGIQDYEELALMAKCRRHVISNSTFSWWGAWLGRHPGQVVIAPKRWSQAAGESKRTASPVDLIPVDWLRA